MSTKKIFIAGHRGMVGSAIYRALCDNSSAKIIVAPKSELDLLDQAAVFEFFQINKFDEVYIAAAKVGGIHANSVYPADFIYENLVLECNLINSAYRSEVGKLLFLGSSCIYPKQCSHPIVEEDLLTGPLEATNEPYALAKIAGISLCDSYSKQYGVDFRSVMPCNLYGPGDNFHEENSHVVPALIRRFHEAKMLGEDVVSVWGSGEPLREFLYVDDMADACIHVMSLSRQTHGCHIRGGRTHINIGAGHDIAIKDLALLIKGVVGFEGGLDFDDSRPDGTLRKMMDTTKLRSLGWEPKTSLIEGLQSTYNWYLRNLDSIRC